MMVLSMSTKLVSSDTIPERQMFSKLSEAAILTYGDKLFFKVTWNDDSGIKYVELALHEATFNGLAVVEIKNL